MKMNKAKRAKLEAAGYTVTDAAGWLGLDEAESALVDMRIALARELEKVRKEQGVTQGELARRISTRQSGVARMINHPDTSTMDNLIRGLVALGAPISRIAACLALCAGAGN